LSEAPDNTINAEAIRELWASVLRIDTLSGSSNFFELGGDSLAAMNLVSEISRRWDRTIELGVLFQNPQLDDFVAAINGVSRVAETALKHFHAVHYAPGSIPVFCFAHAHYLGPDTTVYFHPGIYDLIHSESVPLTQHDLDMEIDKLIAEIKLVCPQGPYRISGFCHGGWLALAIAQALHRSGATVDYLGFLEVFPRPEWKLSRLQQLMMPSRFRTTLTSSVADFLVWMSKKRFGQRLIGLVDRRWGLHKKLVHFESVTCYRTFEKATFQHGIKIPVHLYVQRELPAQDSFPAVLRAWQAVALHGLHLHPIIDGGHHAARYDVNREAVSSRMNTVLKVLRIATKQAPAEVSSTLNPVSRNVTESSYSEEPGYQHPHAFFAAIRQNASLRFVDVMTGQQASFSELIERYSDLHPAEKRLAFVYQDNSLDSVAAILGLLHAGFALVLLSTKLSDDRKEFLESQYLPFLIRDPSRVSIAGYSPLAGTPRRDLFEFQGPPPAYKIHPHVDLLLTTSGSTGSPKFVKLSLDNLLANAKSIADYLPISQMDVVPLNLPLDYSYGLSLLTSNMLAGGTVVTSVRNCADPMFWDDFRRLKMTSLAGTPDFYYLLDRLGFCDWTLPSLRYFTQAGGAMNIATIRRFAEFAKSRSLRFFVMYGQTEATARISFLPPEKLDSHAGCIGRPIPGGRLEIDSESGELLYRGENIFGGYASSVEDLSTYESPEVLRTGDLATVDEHGIFKITGRLKRIIKIMGARVSLDEMESMLAEYFEGRRFACLRLDGERIRVIYELAGLSETVVSGYLREVLRIPPDVLEVATISQFPLTANGKLDYRALSEPDGAMKSARDLAPSEVAGDR
jgi:acyl-CoA synthetase (AMP-forming)/AMP-acid ligase II/thioesterase domain-containing protein